MTTQQLPPPPPAPQQPLGDDPRRPNRFTSEVMAGGSVTEKPDDELVGGVRGAVGVLAIVALFGILGLFSVWWLVFALGVLVAIFLHELGHFMTAKWTGMKATQFFIGFGPRVWSFRRGETEYGVRALPLGAFVRIVGMNQMDEVEPGDEDRTYMSKSFPRRLLVISAGSIMHMILAIVLLFTVYVWEGERVVEDGAYVGAGAQIESILETGPAYQSDLQVGDQVIAIDGQPVDSPSELGAIVQAGEPSQVLAFTVLRDGDQLVIPVGLGANTDEGTELFGKPYVGISSSLVPEVIDHSVGSAAVNAVTDLFPTTWEMTKGVVKVLNPVNIISHVNGTNDDLATRPTTLVGITAVSDDVGEAEGIPGILFMLAILNVFVGVFNMFPLLPLDGGHAAIATYERIREGRSGKRYYADVAKLTPFAMAVMTALMLLFMSGLYLDIMDPL